MLAKQLRQLSQQASRGAARVWSSTTATCGRGEFIAVSHLHLKVDFAVILVAILLWVRYAKGRVSCRKCRCFHESRLLFDWLEYTIIKPVVVVVVML